VAFDLNGMLVHVNPDALASRIHEQQCAELGLQWVMSEKEEKDTTGEGGGGGRGGYVDVK